MSGQPGHRTMEMIGELASPCFVLCLIVVEAEGLLDCQGWAGIISILRWSLRPVMFGVEFFSSLL